MTLTQELLDRSVPLDADRHIWASRYRYGSRHPIPGRAAYPFKVMRDGVLLASFESEGVAVRKRDEFFSGAEVTR